MADKMIVTKSKLDALATSISAKSGESLPMTIAEMKSAVDGISTSGGTSILQSKTATPTESTQTITADSGYDGLSSVEIGAISSSYVGSGIDRRSSTDLTVSGATVTSPAGYYAESASKSVASGTAGTPSASKGTVSNHQVSITPSVTNTTGYITGGTKNGTAVTVTASELASGNKEITSNGTNIDVVGYSTVSVAVPSSSAAIITDTTDTAGGTVRTITTTDEVHLQTKTITPTSSQQTVLPDSGYDGFSSVIVGASSGGGSSGQTVTGTFTGDNEITVQISCSFAPDVIYIHGDLTGDVSYRGINSVSIIKDNSLYVTSDTSTSDTTLSATYFKSDISGYNESNSSAPHASYSNGVLTIDMVNNTSSNRFASGITYTYKLSTLGSSGGNASYTRTVVASEQTVTPTSTTSDGSTYYSAQLNLTSGLESGEEYIITYNGTEYFYTCTMLWGTNYLLGEIYYFYGNTGLPYPFGILWESGTTCRIACEDSTAVTVKIEKLEFVGTPSATVHTIYFEFSDSTNTSITAYYDSTFISDVITATTPTIYNNKTVTLAELDGVAWYNPANIPLNTELIDFTKCVSDTAIDDNGETYTEEWYYTSDYTPILTNMTFSYKTGRWTHFALYDKNKNIISVFDGQKVGTVDQNNSNIINGTLSGSQLPVNVAYIRLSGSGNNSSYMSLIRTA